MNIKGYFRTVCLFGLALTFVGTASAQQIVPPDQSYKVLPGDILQIGVWGEEELQREVLVRPDGAVSFPLCGEISTRNRSVTDLQEEIKKRLQRYIPDAAVSVNVAEVLVNKVYVIGQVDRPGVFVVNPQVDVLQALSMAGGTTPFANLNDIKILRRNGDSQMVLRFKYDEVTKGRALEQNIVLQSGDVVVVP